jgi:3-(3-hydroxy-phenyl)propionate hydroxylase
MAKRLGVMLSERDPQRARERDARLLREAGGEAPTLIRQELIPPLRHGLIAQGAPRAGEMLPQPRVRDGRGELLMDELLGATWRLVLATDDAAACGDCAALAARHGVPLVLVGDGAAAPAGARRVQERDGLLRDWLAAAGLIGALVRPDHCIYGGFATAEAAQALLQQRAAAWPAADPSQPTGDRTHATASSP